MPKGQVPRPQSKAGRSQAQGTKPKPDILNPQAHKNIRPKAQGDTPKVSGGPREGRTPRDNCQGTFVHPMCFLLEAILFKRDPGTCSSSKLLSSMSSLNSSVRLRS